jgi:glutamyl-tRNA reductase
MKVFCVGLSHHTAKVETRERFGRTIETEERLRANGCAEALVVDTCNRVEVYAAAEQEIATSEIARCVARTLDADVGAHAPTFYRYQGADCAQHLFRVVSGLDSMVVGETEVLGQVKKAYEAARRSGAAGPWLHRLFQRAFRVAKQVRSNTEITRGAVSVGSVAVDLAGKIFGDLAQCKVLLLGAGEAAERTARALVSRGVRHLFVSNRSADRGQELAHAVNARPIPFECWLQRCGQMDILITSTATNTPLLTRELFQPILNTRPATPLFIIDIAVPRNVEPALNDFEGVYLYDIDSLQSVAQQAMAMRRQHIAAAEEIIAQHVTAFADLLGHGFGPPGRDLLHPPIGDAPSPSGAI